MIVVLAVLMHGGVARAQGTVVYGNLGSNGTDAPNTFVSFTIGVSSTNNQAIAYPFKTGADANFLQLQSVTFAFGQPTNTPTPNVQIFSNSAGTPGTLIAALSGSVGGTELDVWTPASPVQLAGSTEYFMVVKDTTGASTGFNWYYNSSFSTAAQQNSSGWSLPFSPALTSTDGGASWSGNTAANPVGISVLAAPEPSSMVIASIGLPALAWIAARRRRSPRRHAAAAKA